jgi:hypothetical protein
VSAQPHPVRLLVTDDLRRSRLTVLVRAFLAIPQLIWAAIWGGIVYGSYRYLHTGGGSTTATTAGGTIVLAWLVTLFSGWLWPELHGLHARFLRWSTHLAAYVFLVANPWPRLDARDAYPVDLQIDPPMRQNRWKTLFRIILAIPALVLSLVFAVVLVVVAFFGWFACLLLGRMPKGMRDLSAYCLRYGAQTSAYLLYLTDRYPALATGGMVAPDAELLDQLAKLQQLHAAGVLTDEELEEKSRLIRERLGPGV